MTQQKRQNTTIYFVLHIFISIMFYSSRSTQSWEKIINKRKLRILLRRNEEKLFEKNVSIKYVLFYHKIRLTLEQKSTFLIYTFLSTIRFFFLKITNHDMNIIMESFYVFSKPLS